MNVAFLFADDFILFVFSSEGSPAVSILVLLALVGEPTSGLPLWTSLAKTEGLLFPSSQSHLTLVHIRGLTTRGKASSAGFFMFQDTGLFPQEPMHWILLVSLGVGGSPHYNSKFKYVESNFLFWSDKSLQP